MSRRRRQAVQDAVISVPDHDHLRMAFHETTLLFYSGPLTVEGVVHNTLVAGTYDPRGEYHGNADVIGMARRFVVDRDEARRHLTEEEVTTLQRLLGKLFPGATVITEGEPDASE